MLISSLLVAHIAVLGYWLGSEFVINSTFRYVTWSADLEFAQRNRLMDHVMEVDQHVRYALILQLGLGFILGSLYGFVPGGAVTAWVAFGSMIAWLIFVEFVHKLRVRPLGARLAKIDRLLRYGLLVWLLGYGFLGLFSDTSLPTWLALKFVLFAGVISCGVGIRFALIHWYGIWTNIANSGSTPENEHSLRRSYVRATSVLILLWVFIAAIVLTSIIKPI